jgi:hypothetical protein
VIGVFNVKSTGWFDIDVIFHAVRLRWAIAIRDAAKPYSLIASTMISKRPYMGGTGSCNTKVNMATTDHCFGGHLRAVFQVRQNNR